MEISQVSRDAARERLIAAFSSLHEVNSLHFFGKEADGKHDQYSDFDLVVVSSDLERTQRNYREIVGSVSPIIGRLILASEPQHMAEMIALRELSPYQKIDLSILADLDYKREFAPFLTVFERACKAPKSASTLAPLPAAVGVEHDLNDVLFSVPRFTKCLFRADFDLYRRWEGVVRQLWAMLGEKQANWQSSSSKAIPAPVRMKLLYGALASCDRERLKTCLPLDGKLDVADSFRNCTHFLVSLARQKALATGAQIDEVFTTHMVDFLDTEIDRYLEEQRPR